MSDNARLWLGFTSFIAVVFFLSLILLTNHYDIPPKTRTFLDKNGLVIGTLYPLYGGNQIWTPLKNIPEEIIQQTIKKEDRFFYIHPGINPASILKAGFDHLWRGKALRGGSTITQQLAKNLIQEKKGQQGHAWLARVAKPKALRSRGSRISRRTLANKIIETLLAFGLEIKHSKGEILERYLNTIYYGKKCYGIASAVKIYFGKNLVELKADEIDFLTSLPKAPNRFADIANFHNSPLPPLKLRGGERKHYDGDNLAGRHFMEYVHKTGRLDKPVIHTSLDLDLQRSLEENLKRLMAERVSKDPLMNAAIVALDVSTGGVLAMVGSRDYSNSTIDGQVNAAVSLRQPGSTLKPFTYFSAFARGYSPDTIISDEPVSYYSKGGDNGDSYIPQNFDRRYHGDMTISEALANSYNVPAVITLNEIGLSYYHDILKKFGITSLKKPYNHYGLSVTLGSGEVSLLELTNAYSALARGGRYLPFRLTPDKKEDKEVPVIPNAHFYAAEVTSILSDAEARLKVFGWNENLMIEGFDVAVKTGTSYDHRDNWTVGYNSQYAVGVWVGHSDGTPLDGTTGAETAAPVWHAVMEKMVRPVSTGTHFKTSIEGVWGERKLLRSANAVWKISSPLPHSHYRIHPNLPEENQQIRAVASNKGSEKINLTWHLDGELLAQTSSRDVHVAWIRPEEGRHMLTVESSDGNKREVPFWVDKED